MEYYGTRSHRLYYGLFRTRPRRKQALQIVRHMDCSHPAPLLAVIAGTGSLLIWRARANHSGTALLAFNIVLFVFALILIFKMPFLLIGWILVRTLHDAARF